MNTRRTTRHLFLIATFIGGLLFVRKWFDVLANQSDLPWSKILLDEMGAAWCAALLLWPVIVAAKRWTPWRWPTILIYLAMGGFFAIAHTMSLWITRSALYPLLGFGSYDYGSLPHRFVMEAPAQLMAFLGTLMGLYLMRQVRQARLSEALQGQLAQSQLEGLRLQLAPHFLFNALNTISSTVYESPEQADRLIGRLSNLLRRMLSNDANALVPLSAELNMVREYVDLQSARFEHETELHFEVPEAHLDFSLPSMILQPLVENAFKHGLNERGALSLSVSTDVVDDRWVVRLSDNGHRPLPDPLIDGVGLNHVRQRLSLTHGSEASFMIRSVMKGNRVLGHEAVMELPL